MLVAYKLFRLRKDETLGPLFIGRRIRIPIGKWVEAEAIPTKGFAFRPGWHACSRPIAPHLSTKGRVWCRVRIKGVKKYQRPETQGGLWYVAKHLRVEEIIQRHSTAI